MWDEGPAETPVDRDRRAIAEAFKPRFLKGTFIWSLLFGFEGSNQAFSWTLKTKQKKRKT